MERSNTRRSSSSPRRVTRLHLGTSSSLLTLRRREVDWRPLHVSLPGHAIAALAVAPDQPETVYAASRDTLFHSADGGAHWRRASVPAPGMSVHALLVVPRPRACLLAGLSQSGILRSQNAGATWQPVNLPPLAAGAVTRFVLAPGDAGPIYAIAAGSLLVSADAGHTWQAIAGLPTPITSLAIHPDAPGTLYVGGPPGLYRTRNAGRSWQRLAPQPITTFIIHPTRPRTLIASLPVGLSHSSNAGANWQLMPGGEAVADDPFVELLGHGPGEIVLALALSGRIRQLRDGQWYDPPLGPTPPILTAAAATTELARWPGAPKRGQARRRRPVQRDSSAPATRPPTPAAPAVS